MQDLIKQFKEARKDFLETIDKFPKSRVEEVLFGEWNLKDVVTHFTGWDEYFTNAVKLLKQSKPVPHWENMNELNKKSVSKAKKSSWGNVYKRFVDSEQELIKEFSNLSKNVQDKLFWKGKKYTPLKFLKVNIHHYKKTHLLKIKKLLDKWEGR